jgi:hypothetical protein
MSKMQERSVAAIKRSREKHIVFPVHDMGCDTNGSARAVFSRWPGLIQDGKLKGRPGIPIRKYGRTFYPLPCYTHFESKGWERTGKILGAFLRRNLRARPGTPVAVILPGSSEMERTWGAKPHNYYRVVKRAAEGRKIVIYADFKKRYK